MSADHEPAFAQEVEPGNSKNELPAYAPMLAAFHRACAAELRAIIDSLPLQGGERVLDMACGDGVYSTWLADRVGPTGSVVGVDIAPAYLETARQQAQTSAHPAIISFEVGSIDDLPLDDGAFDLAWCAHSLYSLPDPIAVLEALRRIVKPGGIVAILENDTLHHMLLPWPAELELAVRQAQMAALRKQTSAVGKFYIGRDLCGAFREAGLQHCAIATRTIDHHAPLSDDERIYLGSYLNDLAERARPYLDPQMRGTLDRLLDPQNDAYLLDQAGFFASQLEIVGIARKS